MEYLIKGVRFEGWRKIGNPRDFAREYYVSGIDELIYMDVVASLYERNTLSEVIRGAAEEVLIPITVGGGVRSLADVRALLAVGADKVAINTAATQDPSLLKAVSDTYGSQAAVLSIEASARQGGGWLAMTDNGRNHTGRDVVRWAVEGASLGAGELLVTSIDRDGTRRGLDTDLMAAVTREVDVPVVGSGGVGRPEHLVKAILDCDLSAVAIGTALHHREFTIADARDALRAANLSVRRLEEA